MSIGKKCKKKIGDRYNRSSPTTATMLKATSGKPFFQRLPSPVIMRGISQKSPAHGAIAVLYAVSLGLWLVAEKSTQFYYHYFLPSTFLLIALALTLDDLWQAGWRKVSGAVLVLSALFFGFFYEILAAEPLAGPDSFTTWAWIDGWK